MFLKEKIKEARLEKKMTQKQLAEELTLLGRKTSNTAIANWESGLNSPDVDTLQLICKILDKDGNYFFSQDTNNNNFIFLGRNKAGKYLRYRSVSRKLKKRFYLYENDIINLNGLISSLACYNHLCTGKYLKFKNKFQELPKI